MRVPDTRMVMAAMALAGWLVSTTAAGEGNAENGRRLAYTCMGCHGIENQKNAYPKYSVPKLGGQNAAYIVAALTEYNAGARWHPTMTGLASTLSPQDRLDLGAWFQSATAGEPAASGEVYKPAALQTCIGCHGEDGVGVMPEYPTLGGQHEDYLDQVLDDYRMGRRENAIMNAFASQLAREDVVALAAYYAALPGLHTPSLR